MAAKRQMNVQSQKRMLPKRVKLRTTAKNPMSRKICHRSFYNSNSRVVLIRMSLTSEKRKWSSSSSALARSSSSLYLECIITLKKSICMKEMRYL